MEKILRKDRDVTGDLKQKLAGICPPNGKGFVHPGFVDFHIHGAFGWDFSLGNTEKVNEMLDSLLTQGIIGILPTIITCPADQLLVALRDLRAIEETRKDPPFILGIYLEGPFLSPERGGSHSRDLLRLPNLDLIDEWNLAAGGLIKVVTVAPELPGAMDFISGLVANDILPAIGHTNADHRTAETAIRKGATHVTHLFNAMRPFTHRDPTAVSAILKSKESTIELIGDAIHLSPEILDLIFSIYPREKIVLVSDGVCPMGLIDGEYPAYGTTLELKSGKCTFPGGHLFGGGKLLSRQYFELLKAGHIAEKSLKACVFDNPLGILGKPLIQSEVYFDEDYSWLASKVNEEWFFLE